MIGDVCGTGPDAAAVTAIARHTIRAAATHGVAPSEVLEWLNDALYAGNRDLFCTTLYATVEPAGDGTWRYISVTGGHPLPILLRADGSAQSLGRPGRLVGALPAVAATPFEATLAPGDTLVLYTDGVTDLHPPHHLDDEAFRAMVAGDGHGDDRRGDDRAAQDGHRRLAPTGRAPRRPGPRGDPRRRSGKNLPPGVTPGPAGRRVRHGGSWGPGAPAPERA